MLFHSRAFLLVFLPLCLAGFFLIGHNRGPLWAVRWLIAASLVFHGWWDPRFVPLLVGSILVNHALARGIRALCRAGEIRAARRWLTGGIVLNLTVLAWFKYADFALAMFAPDRAPLDLALPLAISFFTFQQIMVLMDAHANPDRDTGLSHAAAFIAFFPHLIAGPLVRPGEIIPQLRSRALATPRMENITAGLVLLLLGLGKKLVLADLFGGFADTGFDAAASGAALTFFEAWYATLAYALQIYFDFSGYSDMAVGLARMMNVRFPRNFDSPYQAADIGAFWRRWHITLGDFLRDHVYIPLGGSRAGTGQRIVNLMVTMLLCGLWHGAAWRFVLWGGLHGLFLAIHVMFRQIGTGHRKRRPDEPFPRHPLARQGEPARHGAGWGDPVEPGHGEERRMGHSTEPASRAFPPSLARALARALTLFAVVVAWVPFRAGDLDIAWSMLRAMAGANGIALPAMIVGFCPPLAWIATAVPVLPHLGDARTLSFPETSACLCLGWFIVLALPNLHTMSERARVRALTAGFAFTVQALFFAPRVAPFLYFQF